MDAKAWAKAFRATLEAYPLPPRLHAMLDGLPLDRLVFEPVPVQVRRDGWSPARQVGFILRLALCSDVARAARAVGMSRESAWRLRRRPGAESFAAAWDEAAGWGADRLTDLGLERSLQGEVRGVYYRGRKVGEEVRFNNSLLIAVLNRLPANDPPPASGEDLNTAFNRALTALGPETPPLESKDFLPRSA